MKSFLNNVLVVSSFALLALSSCKKDDKVLTATSGNPGVLTASATTLVLNSAKLTDASIVETFTINQANFGYNAAISNELQIGPTSDNFANPYKLALGADVFTQSYNTADFNALILKAGFNGGTAAQISVRVKSTITNSTITVYSNVVNLTVTPFNLTSYIYVVGAFQGWNASSPDSLVSATGNGVYTGIINFTAGNNQFLILPAKNYNNKYATSDNTTPSTTVSYNASNNLNAPSAAGQYFITFNQKAGTITFALADTYSVIGSSTGPNYNFSDDIDLTKYVNNVAGYWTGTIPLTAGTFKFRQNHAWGNNWGDLATPDGKSLVANGGNINLAATGNYKINFYIQPSTGGTVPVSPLGASSPITATYTAVKQ